MIKQATKDVITDAAAMLRAGEVVAFPTETVYGLGADATNVAAIEKIYAVKGRPSHNPLIIHVASLEQVGALAVMDDRALSLAESLWPGPLTLVMPARANNGITAKATAGLDTIAVRIPAHPVAFALLSEVGRPIAAPSANPSGFLSPTNADHVAKFLGDKVGLVLAGGASAVGLESTVLDLTGDVPLILRPGAISPQEFFSIIGEVGFAGDNESIKSPGQLSRHYATRTPLRLNAVDVKAGEAFLGFGNTGFIGAEHIGFARDLPYAFVRNLSPEGDLHAAATNLYAMLHELDQAGASGIAVQAIPQSGLGIAINDRLKRAAVKE